MAAHRAHPDGAALVLQRALGALVEDNLADEAGRARPERPPLKPVLLVDDPAEQDAMEQARDRTEVEARHARYEAYLRTLERQTGLGPPEDDYGDDVARTS